jgi:hypothetical protein
MNVGVYLKARKEDEGGGYTITYDILYTLLKNPRLINHKLYFVIINYLPEKIKNILKKKKINYININESNIILKIKNFIFSNFTIILKIYNYLNLDKVNNFFKNNNVKVIWPISSELRYPFSIPYFFTLWDLQHKTIPEYKEVGSFLTKFYREQLIKENLIKSKYMITGNKFGKKEILKYYKVNKNKIILNNHPTPTWAYKKNIKNNYFLIKNKIKNYFLYPANFWSHKNHLNLIKGFYYFNKKNNNNYQLVLVGNIVDINVYKKIVNFINEKSMHSSIKIMGFIDRKDLLTLYDNCIALSYLSVSGPENLPPLEAFARGKPVLYSNFKGAKDQLKDYPLYINYKNPLNIARGMKIILKKKNLSKTYIKFAKTRSTKKYINKINSILKK